MTIALGIPEKVVVWQFAGKPGNLKSQNSYSTNNGGNGYSMLNRTINQYLTYKEVPLGINLQFTTDSNLHKTHFRLPDGREREILTGEKVALGVGGGKAFLRYAHRTSGINLDWFNDDPEFQWRIYGPGSKKGQPIATNSWVALINAKVEPQADFLVYLDRIQAGDIGWTTSPDWKGKISDWITGDAFKILMASLV